jgi:hypothetical protein
MKRSALAVMTAGAITIGVLAPPATAVGTGKPVKLGKRNPAKGTVTRTTTIEAKTKVAKYGLRVRNRGAGGSVLATCRSAFSLDFANPAVAAPCLRSHNTGPGEAFQFSATSAEIVGVIQTGTSFAVPNPAVRPLVTNATGEATGFNSDKVDGLDAQQIIDQARQGSPIAGSPSFAFARVSATGTTDQSRSQGVTDASIKKGTEAGVYCFYSLGSRPKSANVTLDGVPGETSVDTTTGAGAPCPEPIAQLEMFVRTYDSAGVPADRPFYVTITGTG